MKTIDRINEKLEPHPSIVSGVCIAIIVAGVLGAMLLGWKL